MVGLNSDCTDFIIIPYYIHNYNTYVDWINSMHKYSVKNNFLYNLHTQKNLANLYVYQGRIQARAVPKIVKNMIFLRKIEIFHTKYHKTLRASLRKVQRCLPFFNFLLQMSYLAPKFNCNFILNTHVL
jgi:hypothetical protein